MHPVDWAIVAAFISWLVWDGIKRTKLERTTESYFLANRSLPWWAVGLSVMATQLSAITLVGTTGQGYNDGLRFIQFYYGLPIAMMLVAAFAVPFYFKARVFTAYEYLERRFDPKTRALTSLLFLFSRAMACGAIVAAPAVVLSVILGWEITTTTLVILVPAIVYTMLGGVQAVTWTDVKVMALTVFVLVAAIVFLVVQLPDGVSIADALRIAGSTGKLTVVDTRVTLTETIHALGRADRRPVPDAVLLRLRPEPGAALSDGEIDRRGPHVAPDERVLEDPAAGAGPAGRRLHLCLLHLPHAADAVQRRPRARRGGERTISGVPGARRAIQDRV